MRSRLRGAGAERPLVAVALPPGLTPLYPVEGDLFVTAYQRPCFIRCLRDEAGTVRGLSLSSNRVQELELNKV